MKIIFFGTAEFAIPSFRTLIESKHEVLALVTQPDRKRGRNLKVSPPPVKVIAETHGIPVYQPEDASSGESVMHLKSLGADLFVVIAFGQILRREALAAPRIAAINLHGSLLPRYRGAAPTNWAIINGDTETGVTVIRMNEKMDEGDIIMRKEIEIEPGDTNITISEKLSDIGAGLLIDSIELLESGRANFEKQDASLATPAPKLTKRDGFINWEESSIDIHNKVRGLLPWPGAYTCFNGKVLKLTDTELLSYPPRREAVPGEVLDIIKGKGIVVNAGLGAIAIRHLQLEGGKVLDADAFVRGHKIAPGYVFR
ncbi:MAG: methionyl-tRNA formyltransferase [Candidatus Omnitrophica bacterium]|nr:methionyl-tRNA formyltransferase [Candidatus Omnitrophota bacterium]